MNHTYEKLSSNKAKLTITIDAAAFDEAMQKAYLKNNIKFYQMIPADASSYNKAVEAGYTTPESIEALLSGKKGWQGASITV